MEPIPLQPFGKILIVFGVTLIIIGALLVFGNKIPYLGKLPGDILIQKKNFTFYFPITTLIVLNILILIVIHFVKK